MNHIKPPPNSVRLREAHERTGIALQCLRARARKGQIRSIKIGKLLYLHEDDVKAMEPRWQGQAVEVHHG